MPKPSIGILGAGKLGIVLAQLATKAGYTVVVAGSGDPGKIRLTVSVLVPKASVASKEEVIKDADIVILALPLSKYKTIPRQGLTGKLVIDAMNYWWEVDGDQPDLAEASSETVQRYLHTARVAKAFSHIGYHDLYDETRPNGAVDRRAMAFAANSPEDRLTLEGIIDDFGFDPVYVGKLKQGRVLQPGGPVFGVHVDETTLRTMLQSYSDDSTQ